MPKITLWFLQASRSIRTAWLLEELGLDYEVKFSDRENGVAPAAFKKEAGGLGKFPTLQDGDITLFESGNITECVEFSFETSCVATDSAIDISATPTTSSTDYFHQLVTHSVIRFYNGCMHPRRPLPCMLYQSYMLVGTRKAVMSRKLKRK